MKERSKQTNKKKKKKKCWKKEEESVSLWTSNKENGKVEKRVTDNTMNNSPKWWLQKFKNNQKKREKKRRKEKKTEKKTKHENFFFSFKTEVLSNLTILK